MNYKNYKGWTELMNVYESLPLWREVDEIGTLDAHQVDGKIRKKQWGIHEYAVRMHSLVELIKDQKPKNIVEVGFNMGHSACLILNNIPEDSYLTTFDICKYGYEIECYEILKKYFNNIELVIGDSFETLKNIDGEIDFAFIDGNHAYEFVKSDVKNVKPKIKSSGMLLFDDNYANGVKRTLRETDWTGFERIDMETKDMTAYKKKEII